MKSFLFLLLLLPNILFSQVTIKGVTKSKSETLYFSHISFKNQNGDVFTTISDTDGKYSIILEEGKYQIKSTFVGYPEYTKEVVFDKYTEFDIIFPDDGQDIEFIEDFISRVGEDLAGKIIMSTWNGAIDKKDVRGIHGTLFYDSLYKKRFYPNKKESDL